MSRREPTRSKTVLVRRENQPNRASTTYSGESRLVNRGYDILPDLYFVKLPYQELIETSTTTTGVSGYTFAVNSIYDPNVSGTGHQPLGHDQLATLWERYTVFGVKYDIKAVNMSSTPCRVCTVVYDSSHTFTTFEDASEQPKASKTMILGGSNGGNDVLTFEGYISTAAAAGVPKTVIRDDDLWSASFGANPAKMPLFSIMHANLNGVSTTDVHYVVTLIYYVRLKDRVELSTS